MDCSKLKNTLGDFSLKNTYVVTRLAAFVLGVVMLFCLIDDGQDDANYPQVHLYLRRPSPHKVNLTMTPNATSVDFHNIDMHHYPTKIMVIIGLLLYSVIGVAAGWDEENLKGYEPYINFALVGSIFLQVTLATLLVDSFMDYLSFTVLHVVICLGIARNTTSEGKYEADPTAMLISALGVVGMISMLLIYYFMDYYNNHAIDKREGAYFIVWLFLLNYIMMRFRNISDEFNEVVASFMELYIFSTYAIIGCLVYWHNPVMPQYVM